MEGTRVQHISKCQHMCAEVPQKQQTSGSQTCFSFSKLRI